MAVLGSSMIKCQRFLAGKGKCATSIDWVGEAIYHDPKDLWRAINSRRLLKPCHN